MVVSNVLHSKPGIGKVDQPTKNYQSTSEWGFTLIELLSVVSIISTLTIMLWNNYDTEMLNQGAYATIRNAQHMVNALAIEDRAVTNPNTANYQYQFAESSDTSQFSVASIRGVAIPEVTLVSDEGVLSNRYQFIRTNSLLCAIVELPGLDWNRSFHGAGITLFSTNEMQNNASKVELCPRSTRTEVTVDLTAMSRFIKSRYYWQQVR